MRIMRLVQAALICSFILLNADTATGRVVSFPTPDGGVVYGDLQGEGSKHGIILVHGRGSDRSDWARQARRFADEGYVVLAIDLRGVGWSQGGGMSQSLYRGGTFLDVLGSIQFLLENEIEIVSVIGFRTGASAAAYATTRLDDPNLIGSVVLLGPPPFLNPEKVPGKKLVLISPSDPLEKHSRLLFEEFSSPKKLVEIENPNRDTDLPLEAQETKIMEEILSWLDGPVQPAAR